LLRVRLLRLHEEEHIVLLTMHHIVSDGWSGEVLIQELAALYGAFSQQRSSPLSDLPIQYADFAHWQCQWMRGEVLDQQLAYWKEQLAGSSPVLELPTDRPRSTARTLRGATQSIQLPRELSEALIALSRREGVTLFMTLLAAFQTLLHRYSGQDDIVVGSPVAGRTQSEIEGLIGFFVNTLVLRADFSGDPSFREILQQIRKVCLDAYAHQDLPYEKLVEELHPERGSNRHAFFQVWFQLAEKPIQELKLLDITLSPLEIDAVFSEFDLWFQIIKEKDNLKADMHYSTDLFNADTIVRILEHFRNLLEDLVTYPETGLSALSMLTSEENEQLISGFNADLDV
jgi:aspartate racemase